MNTILSSGGKGAQSTKVIAKSVVLLPSVQLFTGLNISSAKTFGVGFGCHKANEVMSKSKYLNVPTISD